MMFEVSCRGVPQVPRRAAACSGVPQTCRDVPQRGRRAAAAPADRSVLRRAVECCSVLQRATWCCSAHIRYHTAHLSVNPVKDIHGKMCAAKTGAEQQFLTSVVLL